MKGNKSRLLDKRNKGITLIALVVTIIVLIILAGVSINLILGKNGIISRAKEAKIKTDEAYLKEQIELAVLDANTNEFGEIDLNRLEDNLNHIKEITAIEKIGEDETLPWIVTADDVMFKITEDHQVILVKGIVLSPSQIMLEQGQSKTINAILAKDVKGNITWESSDSNIVSVNNEGMITAIAARGTVTITAKITSNGETYEDSVKVIIVGLTDIYARLYDDGTLTLSSLDTIDTNKTLVKAYDNIRGTKNVPWSSDKSSIITVEVINEISPISIEGWFSNCSNLTSCNLSGLDTVNITRMVNMFYSCEKLESLDISNFDTSNVTNMGGMFWGCGKLTNINVTNFDTSNVTNMNNMFGYCGRINESRRESFQHFKCNYYGWNVFVLWKVNKYRCK